MSKLIPFSNLPLIPKISIFLFSASLILLSLGISSIAITKHQYNTTFYPGVRVDDIPLGGLTMAEAEMLLKDKHAIADGSMVVTLRYGSYTLSSSAAQLRARRNYEEVLQQAYTFGRSDFLSSGVWQLTAPHTKEFTTELRVDPQHAQTFIDLAKHHINEDAEPPAAILLASNTPSSLKMMLGKDGQVLNADRVFTEMVNHLDNHNLIIQAEVATLSAHLSDQEIAMATNKAKKLVGKEVTFRADNVMQKLNDQQLISLLNFPNGIAQPQFEKIASEWQKIVDRQPQDAVFEYDHQTLKVKTFVPPRKGLELDKEAFKNAIDQAIIQLTADNSPTSLDLPLPVKETNPQVALDKTNSLGIKEQIGFGDSEYFHSIPGRIHNVALTASRINNTIVKPGEEFSFNNTLGDVSAATGFEPAYVIKDGRTQLGDGGGVCQVSTTLFRALLNAGLPITKRHAHSYRVSYYELNSKPGVDATVYGGDVDLRFINDTGHDILIHTQTDSEKLYMSVELYGTSDGRTAEIVNHITWDPVPAPPPQYIDDPTLPHGKLKQVDFAASGIKAKFTNVVKDKNGKIIRQDEYFSDYQPWRAIYLRGV